MERLHPPDKFPFPFTPYHIQDQFMHSLYNTLEEGKLGIFESPTGTGKSMSLICGALTWLRDNQDREKENLEKTLKELEESVPHKSDDCEPFSWLNEQTEQVEILKKKNETKYKLDKIQNREQKFIKMRAASLQRKTKKNDTEGTNFPESKVKTAPFSYSKSKDNNDDDDDLLLMDIANDDQSGDLTDDEDYETTDDNSALETKIYFCSRTHSQLSQFVGEVRKSPFGSDTRLVSLASRQNYCINEAVHKLKSSALINERCLELQKNKGKKKEGGSPVKKKNRSSKKSSCPALNQQEIGFLSEDILMEVQDVEQVVVAGRKQNACPYYASRGSIESAQVVVIPYNTLLHKSTRKACGINLKNSIVIIDEAHNLLEAIGHIHSAQVNGQELAHAHSQLLQYKDRYQTRLSASNLLYIEQILFVIGKLIRSLGGKPGCAPEEATTGSIDSKLFTLSEFVSFAKIDNYNIFNLLNFCNRTKIFNKLRGFSERYFSSEVKPAQKMDGIRSFLKNVENISQNVTKEVNQDNNLGNERAQTSSNCPILNVIGFLETLTNDYLDGRIVVKREQYVGKSSLKFLLLNPASHFKDIVEQAKSVIVAGGTMQPISEFQDQLFIAAGGHIDRIQQFSCGHVIPPENILPIALGSGPNKTQYDFSFLQRESTTIMNELGRLLVNVCTVVPAGIVCFFPSYDYEKRVVDHLTTSGVIEQLQKKKKLFREPKKSSQVDSVLNDYSACIRRCSKGNQLTGALLFSVIGGKLSEGLNFSDDLGRCVIVVGLPYPNLKSVELAEQMKYLDIHVGSGAGQTHYENLCMKAVNQSIGRAVRHKDDYAAVLLVDHRYLQPRRQSGMPKWIQKSLQSHQNFGPAFSGLCRFFNSKRNR